MHANNFWKLYDNSKDYIFSLNGVEDDKSFQFVDPFWELTEDLASKIHLTEYFMQFWKEIVPFVFEDSLKFKFEKINLKYKIDAN